MTRIQTIGGCAALIALLVPGRFARATLGEGTGSIDADRAELKGVQQAPVPHAGYSVTVVTSDATTVREYVSPSGTVFAVAWNGYVHPDLTQLLGTYWNDYKTARETAVRRHGRRRQQLATNNLVVETWGHMRDLRGRAYIPALLPPGMSIDEIR